jgi:hypothetical protein
MAIGIDDFHEHSPFSIASIARTALAPQSRTLSQRIARVTAKLIDHKTLGRYR